jgi:hypothetical protein
MFSFIYRSQHVQSYREVEGKAALLLFALMLPAMFVGIVAGFGLLAYELGLPGSDVGAYFMHDASELLISTIVYVLAISTVSAVLRALSDPVETKVAIWTFIPWLCSFFPKVVQFLDSLGCRTTDQPVLTTPLSLRFAIRPQSPIPALCFSPGASPQLE